MNFTQAQLAEMAGTSPKTLRQWRSEGLNLQDVPAVMRRAAQAQQRESNGTSLAEAKLEKLHAETARIRHALEVDQGRFVSAEAVLANSQAVGLAVRAALEQSADQLPPALAGRTANEIHTILKRHFRNVLVSLSEHSFETSYISPKL